MRTFGILFLTIFLFAVSAAAAGQRPNIVFFLFDDMGWGQPQSCNPKSALRTPNLDKVATAFHWANTACAENRKFTSSAACTPR